LQEEIERRTVALSVNAATLTGRGLAKALAAACRKIQKNIEKGRTPQGRQSVKKLMNHRVTTNALPLDGETKLFDQVARKFNVDYAFYQKEPKKYLLFFKAGQADAITQCMAEYAKVFMERAKSKKPSILENIKKHGERARATPPRERERKREAAREER
jgi:hypothetical protein